MPGPVSDSYDPEWGTAANGGKIETALRALHARLTEKQWQVLRFACERAAESV